MVGFAHDAALHCQAKQRFDPSLSRCRAARVRQNHHARMGRICRYRNRNLRHHAQSVAFGLHRGRQQRRCCGGSGFGRRTRSARQRRRRLHPLTRAQLRRVRAETHARPQQLRAERIGSLARFGMRPCLDPQRARQRGFAGHRRPNSSPRPVCLPAAARKRFCRQPETRNRSSENRFLETDMVWRRQRRRHGSRVRP